MAEWLDTLLAPLTPSYWGTIPLDEGVEWFVKEWLVPNFRAVFRAIQTPVEYALDGIEVTLQATPFPIFLVIAVILGWRAAGYRIAIFTALALLAIDAIGVWSETMTTLSMIVTAIVFCTIVGVPLGIIAAGSDRFAAVIRPILDIMQTIPPFVYLVPIVMLFGVGVVPGVIATIIFALPPIIRLTNLGIRQVQSEIVEAGYAFGATRWQVLMELEIPLALRTIMAGLNQTLMLSLSMVVIAALIGAGGLGLTVFTGLGRLDVGRAFIGGLGIVLLAIILDRVTQALGDPTGTQQSNWSFAGVFRKLLGREEPAEAPSPAGDLTEAR